MDNLIPPKKRLMNEPKDRMAPAKIKQESETCAKCNGACGCMASASEKTPYQKHNELGHKTTFNSPDAYSKVEECEDCGARYHLKIVKAASWTKVAKDWETCTECGGEGHMDGKECPACEGTGRLPKLEAAYGDKRSHPKIEIFVDKEYKATTTWAKTCQEAKEKYLAEHKDLKPEQVQCSFKKEAGMKKQADDQLIIQKEETVPLVDFDELTDEEKKTVDYFKSEESGQGNFFRFDGDVFDLGEFVVVENDELANLGYIGFDTVTAWSGYAVKEPDMQNNQVTVAYFYYGSKPGGEKKAGMVKRLVTALDEMGEDADAPGVGDPEWTDKVLQESQDYFAKAHMVPDQDDLISYIRDIADNEAGIDVTMEMAAEYFQDWSTWRDTKKASLNKKADFADEHGIPDDEIIDDMGINGGPSEEDVIIQGEGTLGAETVAYAGGKKIAKLHDDWDKFYGDIYAWMQKENYYPNVWQISDHGNASIDGNFGEYLGRKHGNKTASRDEGMYGESYFKQNGFTRTDEDTNQWVKKISENEFMVFDHGVLFDIDLKDYSAQQLEDAVKSYYGGGMKEVSEHYGADANKIVAEIIAESDMGTEASSKTASRDEEIVKRDVELEQAAIDEYRGQKEDASPDLQKVLEHTIEQEREHRKEFEEKKIISAQDNLCIQCGLGIKEDGSDFCERCNSKVRKEVKQKTAAQGGSVTLRFEQLPPKVFDYMNEMRLPNPPAGTIDTEDWQFTFSYADDGAIDVSVNGEHALSLEKDVEVDAFREVADLIAGGGTTKTAADESYQGLGKFVGAYLEAALWSELDQSDEQGGDPLDKNYDFADISPESMDKAKADCAAFKEKAGELLNGIDEEQAGHDFWLTRNGHGAGFWDRGLGEVGDKLTEIAHSFGEINLVIGDDNKLYLEGSMKQARFYGIEDKDSMIYQKERKDEVAQKMGVDPKTLYDMPYAEWAKLDREHTVKGSLDKAAAEGIRRKGPGKFSTIIDEILWTMSLDGLGEEAGSVETGGWYGLLRSVTAEEAEKVATELEVAPLTAEEKQWFEANPFIILWTGEQGFVESKGYASEAEAQKEWEGILADTAEEGFDETGALRKAILEIAPNDLDSLTEWVLNDEGLYNWAMSEVSGGADAVGDLDNPAFVRWMEDNAQEIAAAVNKKLGGSRRAGLSDQVKSLRRKLKDLDVDKADPSEIASTVDALEKLEKRLKDQQETRKTKKEEKAKAAEEAAKTEVTAAAGEPTNFQCEKCGYKFVRNRANETIYCPHCETSQVTKIAAVRESKLPKKQQAELDRVVQDAVYGYQINIMDIGKVYKVAEAAYVRGEDVTEAVHKLLDTIATKTASFGKNAEEVSFLDVYKECLELDKGDERKAVESALSMWTGGAFDAAEGERRQQMIDQAMEFVQKQSVVARQAGADEYWCRTCEMPFFPNRKSEHEGHDVVVTRQAGGAVEKTAHIDPKRGPWIGKYLEVDGWYGWAVSEPDAEGNMKIDMEDGSGIVTRPINKIWETDRIPPERHAALDKKASYWITVWKQLPNSDLEISIDAEGQAELKEKVAAGDTSDNLMYEVFEPVTDAGLMWVNPEDIGALTSAPILSDAVLDDAGHLRAEEGVNIWWYPNYQVWSPLEDLAETGKTVFTLAPEDKEVNSSQKRYAKYFDQFKSSDLSGSAWELDKESRRLKRKKQNLKIQSTAEFFKNAGYKFREGDKVWLYNGDKAQIVKRHAALIAEDKKYDAVILDTYDQPTGATFTIKEKEAMPV